MTGYVNLHRLSNTLRRDTLPNITSAKKRTRQNIKRRAQNRIKKSAIRTEEKKFRKLLEENKIEDANKSYQAFASLIDKASKTNLIHKNNAARKKSRLAALFKKVAGKGNQAEVSAS